MFCFQPLSLAHRLWFTDNIVNDDVELFIVVPFESGSFKSCSLYFLSFLFSFGEGGVAGEINEFSFHRKGVKRNSLATVGARQKKP